MIDSGTVDTSLQPAVSDLSTPNVSTPTISTSPVTSLLGQTCSQSIGAALGDTALGDTVLVKDEVLNTDESLKESGLFNEKQVEEDTEQQDLEIRQDTIIDTVNRAEVEPEDVVKKSVEEKMIETDQDNEKGEEDEEGEEEEEDLSFDPYDSG